MLCPFCREKDTSVVDSRPTEDGAAIRRRRVCVFEFQRERGKERREQERKREGERETYGEQEGEERRERSRE